MLDGLYDALVAFGPLLYRLLIVIGLLWVGLGVIKAATHARSTNPPQQLKSAMTSILIGGLLIAFPNLLNISSSSMGLSSDAASVLSGQFATMDGSEGLKEYAKGINFAFAVIQIVGALGFARGWMMLNSLAKGGGGQGASVGHALTLIIGGTIAVNIKVFLELMGKTMGGSAETIIGFLIGGGASLMQGMPSIN